MKRTPKHYDGVQFSGKKIGVLLPELLQKIQTAKGVDPESIFITWSELISQQMATYTKPIAFKEGILKVLVYSSTLYNLLTQYEKPRLLKSLREKHSEVRDIVFRIS